MIIKLDLEIDLNANEQLVALIEIPKTYSEGGDIKIKKTKCYLKPKVGEWIPVVKIIRR